TVRRHLPAVRLKDAGCVTVAASLDATAPTMRKGVRRATLIYQGYFAWSDAYPQRYPTSGALSTALSTARYARLTPPNQPAEQPCQYAVTPDLAAARHRPQP